MQTPEKVDSLFVFESGSINTIIKDNHGNIYTNESENNAGDDYVSPLMAFREALAVLLKDEMISAIQDYCCIYKLDCEMAVVGFSSVPDFLARLPQLLPEGTATDRLPKESNFKRLAFGSRPYPDWNWETFGEKSRSHVQALCKAYIRFMASKGFMHPCLQETPKGE